MNLKQRFRSLPTVIGKVTNEKIAKALNCENDRDIAEIEKFFTSREYAFSIYTLEQCEIIRQFERRIIETESVSKALENADMSESTMSNSDFLNCLDGKFLTALIFGGMMFKPYLSHGKIHINLIRADFFLPVSFVGKTMTSAVFVSKKTVGNVYFTLLECHEFNAENQTHTIKNKV